MHVVSLSEKRSGWMIRLTHEGESGGSCATKSSFLCGTSVSTQSQQRLLVERKVVVIAITEGWKGKRGEWMVSVDGRRRGGLLHKTQTESQKSKQPTWQQGQATCANNDKITASPYALHFHTNKYTTTISHLKCPLVYMQRNMWTK